MNDTKRWNNSDGNFATELTDDTKRWKNMMEIVLNE